MANIHTASDHMLEKHQISLAITAATTNATGFSTKGFEKALAIFYAAPSGSGTTSDCKLQESSDDGSTDAYADVANAAFAQVTTAGGAKIQVMNINLSKREEYLRLVHTGAGGSAAGQAYALIILYNGRTLPPTHTQTVITV